MRNFDSKRYTPRPKKLLRASLSFVFKGHYHLSACASYSIQAEVAAVTVEKAESLRENEYLISPKEQKKSGQMF